MRFPRSLSPFFLAFSVVMTLALTWSVSSVPWSEMLASIMSSDNIVALTNQSRQELEVPSLTDSPLLSRAAQAKAEDMLARQYFAHHTPEGKTAWEFLDEVGYNYVFAGENLAMNFNSAEGVLDGWLTSPGHRENLLSDRYADIGIGTATGDFLGVETTIVVQMFGRVMPQKSSEKIPRTRREQKLVMNTDQPFVKGASVEKLIVELQQTQGAQWLPGAKKADIYGAAQLIGSSVQKTVLMGELFLGLFLMLSVVSSAIFWKNSR